MAEFVSTTTPTYSDPLRAQSIKALEQRHKEMLAQSAAAGAITPENTATPVQGLGHLANTLGDSFQRSRVDQAAAAQRQALAQTIAGMDPNNPKPHEIATINSADPELARQMLTQLAEYRRAQMQNETTQRGQNLIRESSKEGHDVTRAGNEATVAATLSGQSNQAAMETARLEAAKEAAAEKVRTDEIARQQGYTQEGAKAAQKVLDDQVAAAEAARVAREAKIDEEQRLANRPASEGGKIMQDVQSGKLPQETGTAMVDKLAAPDPKRAEAVRDAETEYRKSLSHLDNLEEAAKILDQPDAIYTGSMQKIAPEASGYPIASAFVNKEKAQRTARFNSIVGEDAVRDMANTLKGSSTNFEMQKFERMKNDPNISDAKRAEQLRKVIVSARADLEAQAKETKTIGGDVARVDRAMGKGGAPVVEDKNAAARKWLEAHPNDPDAPAVRAKLGIK